MQASQTFRSSEDSYVSNFSATVTQALCPSWLWAVWWNYTVDAEILVGLKFRGFLVREGSWGT